jgi:thioredoxin 1
METKAIERISSDQFVSKILMPKADALVKISSTWNGASQMLAHTLQNLAVQYNDKVNFFCIDHDAESALAVTYRIESVPTLLFFKQGRLVDKLSGLTHRTIISNKLHQLINA